MGSQKNSLIKVSYRWVSIGLTVEKLIVMDEVAQYLEWSNQGKIYSLIIDGRNYGGIQVV
jgi:hypothetical protein